MVLHMVVLAMTNTPGWLMAAGAVAIAVLGVAWFALRFWLASTRPADIKDIPTPRIDRLNQQALEHLARGDEQDDDEEAPEGLKKVVPEEGDGDE
jgi:hypothetical protein